MNNNSIHVQNCAKSERLSKRSEGKGHSKKTAEGQALPYLRCVAVAFVGLRPGERYLNIDKFIWKCVFPPMTPHVRPFGWLVWLVGCSCWLVGWSVCYNFLVGREVKLQKKV